jgi:uncharacterized protein with HEPN domain
MRPEKLYLTDILDAAHAIDRFVSEIPFEGFCKMRCARLRSCRN